MGPPFADVSSGAAIGTNGNRGDDRPDSGVRVGMARWALRVVKVPLYGARVGASFICGGGIERFAGHEVSWAYDAGGGLVVEGGRGGT